MESDMEATNYWELYRESFAVTGLLLRNLN